MSKIIQIQESTTGDIVKIPDVNSLSLALLKGLSPIKLINLPNRSVYLQGSNTVIYTDVLLKARKDLEIKKLTDQFKGVKEFRQGSKIHIKKENEGKFTSSAKKAGMSVQEYASKVLNDPNATTLQKKRANFARNAKKWKHEDGAKLIKKHSLGSTIDYTSLYNTYYNNYNPHFGNLEDYYTVPNYLKYTASTSSKSSIPGYSTSSPTFTAATFTSPIQDADEEETVTKSYLDLFNLGTNTPAATTTSTTTTNTSTNVGSGPTTPVSSTRTRNIDEAAKTVDNSVTHTFEDTREGKKAFSKAMYERLYNYLKNTEKLSDDKAKTLAALATAQAALESGWGTSNYTKVYNFNGVDAGEGGNPWVFKNYDLYLLDYWSRIHRMYPDVFNATDAKSFMDGLINGKHCYIGGKGTYRETNYRLEIASIFNTVRSYVS